jgi:two-component system aerobic respiration control sensor histidine kinase ArcB
VSSKRERVISFNLVFNRIKDLAFDALLKQMPVAFYWLDKEGNCLGCNQEELTLLGLSSTDQFIGKHALALFEKQAWLNSKKVIDTKSIQTFEEICPLKNGSIKYFLTIKAPLLDGFNNSIGLVGLSLDITKRRHIEHKLASLKAKEEAEKLKDIFIKNMQHDLRTPFSGLLSVSKLLLNTEKDTTRKELQGMVVSSADRLLQLLDQVLEVSELGYHPLVYSQFNIQEVITEVTELLNAEIKVKGLKFSIECPKKIIKTDKMRLSRILINLLGNAVKFTQQGSISLIVILKDELIIKVSDTGIGIPADKLDFIFDKFAKVRLSNTEQKFTGSGIGLHIVKQFVSELNGTIKVKSRQNKGSIFTVSLPA